MNVPPFVALGGGFDGFSGVSADSTTAGWLLGFGAEYAFSPNWSAFIEYDYLDFGSKGIAFDLPMAEPVPGTARLSVQNKLSVAKVGVNYKFNWDTPVVAKY